MDERKIRGSHSYTPNVNLARGSQNVRKGQTFVKRVKPKAKSKDLTTGKNKNVTNIVDIGLKFVNKSSTPKASSNNKAVHKRFLSINERPISSRSKDSRELRLSKDSKDQNSLKTRKFSLDPLQNFPVVSKYSYLSNTGYIPENPSKTNQDSYIIHINFADQQDSYLFGVCDGHGVYGGEVSSFIKQRLPQILSSEPNIHINPKKALSTSINKTNEELIKSSLDTKFSGSTLNIVLIQGRNLYCANVGDSRSLLARRIIENEEKGIKKWMSIPLSRDHKPDNIEENKRILAWGGRVQAYQDEDGNPAGPARVWLKSQDLPGLAMSRALGDTVAASVGVICEAEIVSLALTPADKFIVLGSDGVFEFIPNEEIVKLVLPSLQIFDCEGACERVVQESTKRWKSEEEVIDDITCVCVFLDIPNK